MGTRNLTIVIQNGETKIAQYGQWDGYPDGQGMTVLESLQDEGLMQKLANNLSKVRFIDPVKDKEWLDSYNANAPQWSNEPDKRTPEQVRWFKSYMHRDIAAKILENVANSEDPEIILGDESEFLKDNVSCEWAYKINLDKKTLEVYSGGPKFLAAFSINPPPSKDEFLDAFKSDEDE